MEGIASWEQLPSDIQQRILVLSAMPCVRRVCKAARDAFDAVNEKLIIRSAREQNNLAVMKAAALRVAQCSPSLTAVSLPRTEFVTLADLTSAAATGLATRLRKVTGLILTVSSVDEQLQALQECTGLVHLDMSGSQVCTEQHHREATALSAALNTMPNLTYLRINSFCMSPEGFAALVPALHGLTQLRHLDVAGNRAGPKGLRVLAPALSAMPSLKTLNVSRNNCIGLQGAEALFEVLRNTPALTHLNASDYILGTEGAAALAPLLQSMTGLQHLHLQANALEDAGVAALAPALAALPRLHTLNLSMNALGQGAMAALQPVLTREGSPLHTLDLSWTKVGVESAQPLAAALCSASQLQSLNLCSATLCPDGLTALAPAIGSLGPSLEELQIYDESYGAVAAAALAPALQGLTGLTCLCLSCQLGPEGMALVAPALMGMRRLQVLDLSGIPMGPSGAAALSQVLPSLAGSLECLNLSRCKLGTEGAAVLAPALAHTTGLKKLNMSDNELGPGAVAVLIPTLRAMRSLRSVSLLGDLLEEGALLVVRALQGRDTLPSVNVSCSESASALSNELNAVQDVDWFLSLEETAMHIDCRTQ